MSAAREETLAAVREAVRGAEPIPAAEAQPTLPPVDRAQVLDRLAVDNRHRNGWAGRLWPNLLGEIGIYRVSSPGLQEHKVAV